MEHKFFSLTCSACGKLYAVPIYCGDRFCPVCSFPRRARVRNRLTQLIALVKPSRGYGIKHLTLTIANMQVLPSMVSSIQQSFRKLRQTKSWKYHVIGGAFVIEVTGEHGNWHVHLHIVIEARYYRWEDLLRLWMKVSTGRGVWINDLQKRNIVNYLTKYLSKNIPPSNDRNEMNDALKGTRLFQPFGSWFGLNREYKKPLFVCEECGGRHLILYSECFPGESNFFTKEIYLDTS